ncbi:unnamed protein product [Cuscuta epithymum]|uniref:Retrotransposon Copia-like N-terminal domain-containing protein n=1 Tax=Cuscuta epithymum TaxID=186058 RepID=A0AAV0C5W8_9ASTE|nr:unnamed protein product [Cuscuta epithymum]
MSEDKISSISVRLNGANYSYWSRVMKIFITGQGLWGHVTGSIVTPSDKESKTYATDFAKWERENGKFLTWFHNSSESSIGMNFSKYETTKDVWEYLKNMYFESNFAKEYELELSIRNASQGDKSIQEFYNDMTGFWDQLALMEPSDLQLLDSYVKYREKKRLVQFLMALRSQFEPLRGAILHRSPLPSVDGAVHELIAEETRFKVANLSPSSQSVFVTRSCPPVQHLAPLLPIPASHQTQVSGRPRIPVDECGYCHQKGHWKHACPKRVQQTQGRHNSHTGGSSVPRASQPHYRPSAAVAAPTSEAIPSHMLEQFQQYKAFMEAIQGGSSQASAMSSIHSGLHGSNVTGSGIQEADWDRP